MDSDEAVYLTFRTQIMRRVCPDGVEECDCGHSPGTKVTGPFYYDEDPIGTIFTYVGCNPSFCRCKGKKERVDSRPVEMQKVMDVCPENKMNRCLCHDNTIAKFPFDLRTFYFMCRPKRVSYCSFSMAVLRFCGQESSSYG